MTTAEAGDRGEDFQKPPSMEQVDVAERGESLQQPPSMEGTK